MFCCLLATAEVTTEDEEECEEDDEFGPSASSTEEGEVNKLSVSCISSFTICYIIFLRFLLCFQVWCKHGKLFIDGSSSGDVIQVESRIFYMPSFHPSTALILSF